MKFPLLLLAVTLYVAAAVTDLTTDELNGLIRGQEFPVVVGFYNSEDAENTTKLVSLLEGVAANVSGLMPVAKASDAAVEESLLKSMGSVLGVSFTKYPVVYVFPSAYSSSKGFTTPILFKGLNLTNDKTESKLAKVALKNLPFTWVSRISSESNLKSFHSKKVDELPKVISYHNESTTPAVVRAISLTFADRLFVGDIQGSKDKGQKMYKSLDIKSLPAILVYPEADPKNPVFYDGPMTNSSLAEFLDKYAASVETKEEIRSKRKAENEAAEKAREEQRAKERAEKEAKEKAKAEEKKARRRAIRKIVKEREAIYESYEKVWAEADGEMIKVRDEGWDEVVLEKEK